MVLPPDLSRVGDELVAAAARSLRTRRRRMLAARWAGTIVTAALAFAVLTPGRLGSGQSGSASSLLASTGVSTVSDAGCDQPRGARFGLPQACAELAVARVPRATLPHGTSLVRE